MCGACKSGYDYDSIKRKCIRCKPAIRVIGSPGTITFLVVFAVGTFAVIWRVGVSRVVTVAKQTGLDLLTDRMDPRRAGEQGVDFAVSRGKRKPVSTEEDSTEMVPPRGGSETQLEAQAVDGSPQLADEYTASTASSAEDAQRQRFWTSVMTKAKICLAAYQITAATPWTLPGVRFPAVTEAVLKAISIFELNFVQLGSTDCVLRLDYFAKLSIVTIFPFALALVLTSCYWLYVEAKRRSKTIVVDDALEKRRVVYGLLLLFYVALPGCSSYTFRYFSCLRFDRGSGRSDLKALAIDLSISCGSGRYRRWFAYVILMVIVWPIGCPLVVGVILWRNRKRLNPSLTAADVPANFKTLGGTIPPHFLHDKTEQLVDDFFRAQRQYRRVVRQLAKIEKRNRDVPLKAIEFLYEEYEPRTYLFPVFEATRRVVLTGVLAMFYPGSMSQVAVGLACAMISYRVFTHFQPYIEDDDDAVSEVAQTQLVVLFFAAMLVYVAESTHHREGILSSQAFGILLILAFSAAFVVAVYFVLVNVFGHESLLRFVSKRRFKAKTSDIIFNLNDHPDDINIKYTGGDDDDDDEFAPVIHKQSSLDDEDEAKTTEEVRSPPHFLGSDELNDTFQSARDLEEHASG